MLIEEVWALTGTVEVEVGGPRVTCDCLALRFVNNLTVDNFERLEVFVSVGICAGALELLYL